MTAPGYVEAVRAGFLILVPNTELCAALVDAVDRSYLASGLEVWPTPQIRDFGGWLKERYVRRQLIDASLPRCLTDIEERELWRAVVLESAGREFLEPAGAARAARRARRGLLEYGIPPPEIAQAATEESDALLHWSGRFDARCRELGCVSTDRLPAYFAAHPGVDLETAALAWLESPIWRPVVRRWLVAQGARMLHAPSVAGGGATHLVQADSPDEELAWVADWAARQLTLAPDFRAWICVPDLTQRRDELIDTFDAALAPQRFSLDTVDVPAPYAVAGGTPLSGHAPVRAALAVLTACSGRVPFETFSALLRLPDLHATRGEAAAAALLDVELRQRGPSEASLGDWLALGEHLARDRLRAEVAALLRLRTAFRISGEPSTDLPFSRWALVWIEALTAGPWQQRARWSSAEYQAAERFRELVGALATADPLFGVQSYAAATRLLARAAHDTAFQAQTGVAPVWVSGQLMDPWLTYDGIWVAACGGERWPPPVDPLPLIPVRLQRKYGVVSAGVDSQLALATDLQARWRARAGTQVFSWATLPDGRGARRSPLLPAASLLETAPPLRPLWQMQAAQAPLLETREDIDAPAFTPAERTHGVSTLRAQSLCAFRGFADTRLGVRMLDRPAPGFNARERGELLHHALEQVWRELETSARLLAIEPAVRQELIVRCAAAAIAVQVQRRDPGGRWRTRELERLTALLGKWLDTERVREAFVVERLEQGAQTARHGGLEFSVRIDRLDTLVGGGRVLIDYKSGMTAADWRGERPVNPQLPMYALLQPQDLVAVAYGRVNAGDCGFVYEAERDALFKPRGRRTDLEGRPDFAALLGDWARRLDTIARQFAAGHAAVAPTAHACETCHLHALCRVPADLDDAAAPDV